MIKTEDNAWDYAKMIYDNLTSGMEEEHSFYYIEGRQVPYPAICYIRKAYFLYEYQLVPIDRNIEYEIDDWTIIDDLEEFVWRNRYNINYTLLPIEDC